MQVAEASEGATVVTHNPHAIARDIYATLRKFPHTWCQGNTHVIQKDVRARCLLDHIAIRCEPWDGFVLRPFEAAIRGNVQVWNDEPGRTLNDVLSLCQYVGMARP